MKLSKFLGLLLIVAMMFVFVGCGDKGVFEYSGDSFTIWKNSIDYSEDNSDDGIIYVYEGDSYTVSWDFGSCSWGEGVIFELHEKSAGVVKSSDKGTFDYTVETDFNLIDIGETKEYEYWATVGDYYTSRRIKVIVKNLEPLILTNENAVINLPKIVQNDEYKFDLYLKFHDKIEKSFTKNVKIKQFSRLVGEETFIENSVTAVYIGTNDGYNEGVVSVIHEINEEDVGKEFEVYYEHDGVKSNIIVLKTIDCYLNVSLRHPSGIEISEENPFVIFKDSTEAERTVTVHVSAKTPEGIKTGFDYTFYGIGDIPNLQNNETFSYVLPSLDEYGEFYQPYYICEAARYSIKTTYEYEDSDYSEILNSELYFIDWDNLVSVYNMYNGDWDNSYGGDIGSITYYDINKSEVCTDYLQGTFTSDSLYLAGEGWLDDVLSVLTLNENKTFSLTSTYNSISVSGKYTIDIFNANVHFYPNDNDDFIFSLIKDSEGIQLGNTLGGAEIIISGVSFSDCWFMKEL